jgi:hypothetical protein
LAVGEQTLDRGGELALIAAGEVVDPGLCDTHGAFAGLDVAVVAGVDAAAVPRTCGCRWRRSGGCPVGDD